MSNISTTPAVFNFNTHSVRTIVKDGEPWFVAVDVCSALDYKNSRDAVATHLDQDEKGVANGDTLGGSQSLSIISESGLYALVLRSRKPEARKFAKWVTSEVLPAIRKTGKFDVKTASGPLTKEMREAIKNMVMERAKVLPHGKQAGAVIAAWSALKSHFGVTYKEIPSDKYTEALSLIARMQVEWEVVEPEALPAPAKPSYHYPLSAADPHDRRFANANMSPRVLLDPKNRPLELELIDQLEKDGHDVSGARIRIIAMRGAMEWQEMMRARMGSWAARLRGVQEEIESYQGERGTNVLFSRAPNLSDYIERHAFADQFPRRELPA